MRILFLPALKTTAVRNYSGVWMKSLSEVFSRMGHEVCFYGGEGGVAEAALYARQTQVDHALGFNSFFSRTSRENALLVKDAVRGAVAQISDAGVRMPMVDAVFTVRRTQLPGHICVGWAADPELLRPQQDTRELRLLIDHPLYHPGEDRTQDISEQCIQFAAGDAWSAYGFERVVIRRLCNGGAERVLDASPPRPFSRETIPFSQILPEYCQAHVYFVTHRESVGLTVLETAVAGALPVVPEGFVARDLLGTVRHVAYPGSRVPWEKVLEKIDPTASRQRAVACDWNAVARRILQFFEDFRR